MSTQKQPSSSNVKIVDGKLTHVKSSLDPLDLAELISEALELDLPICKTQKSKVKQNILTWFTWTSLEDERDVEFENFLADKIEENEDLQDDCYHFTISYFEKFNKVNDGRLYEILKNNAELALRHAQVTLINRFPEGEPAILADPEVKENYVELLKVLKDPAKSDLIKAARVERGLMEADSSEEE